MTKLLPVKETNKNIEIYDTYYKFDYFSETHKLHLTNIYDKSKNIYIRRQRKFFVASVSCVNGPPTPNVRMDFSSLTCTEGKSKSMSQRKVSFKDQKRQTEAESNII